jgi:hypothetical protein
MKNNKGIIAKITKAFNDASDSPPASIVNCPCQECKELESDFLGKRWYEVDKDIIRKQCFHICLFNAEGFHYYLPAYLTCALSGDDVDYDVGFNAVLFLGGMVSEHPKDADLIKDQASHFNSKQVSTVIAFLEHFALSDDAEEDDKERAFEALNAVWLPIREGLDK